MDRQQIGFSIQLGASELVVGKPVVSKWVNSKLVWKLVFGSEGMAEIGSIAVFNWIALNQIGLWMRVLNCLTERIWLLECNYVKPKLNFEIGMD